MMKERIEMMLFEQEEVSIMYDYPHSLVFHIQTILKDKKSNNPKRISGRTFLEEFKTRYSDYSSEIKELQVAFQRLLIQEFIELRNATVWEKRRFVSTALPRLIPDLTEWEAVELLESLMYLFQWEFKITVIRQWESKEEERVEFHRLDHGMMLGQIDWNDTALELDGGL
jgi:hypothetical protein